MKEYTKVVIFITAGSDEDAQKIAEALLNQKKVACVNIIPKVNSLFWWEGNIDSDTEHLLIVKTKLSVLNEVISLVKGIHRYDVPEIIALPIIGGNRDYLEWIDREVLEE